MKLYSVVRALSLAAIGMAGCYVSADGDASHHVSRQVRAPIVGGSIVEPCAWPSAVYLPDNTGGFCSGTLIHPEVVLFAAHCMDPSEGGSPPVEAVFGESADSEAFSVPITSCASDPQFQIEGNVGDGHDVAFCKLAHPVLNVPVVPVLAGCESQHLIPGASLTTVGFGDKDNFGNGYGVKRQVTVALGQVVGNEGQFPGGGKGTCYGDSGGPWFLKLPSGEWRVACVTSYGAGDCGQEEYCALVHPVLDWLESASGVDLTPCFSAGQWEPTAGCGHFPSDPGLAVGQWSTQCGDGHVTAMSSTCGPPATDSDAGAAGGGSGAGGGADTDAGGGTAGAGGSGGASHNGNAGAGASGGTSNLGGPFAPGDAAATAHELPISNNGGCGCRAAGSPGSGAAVPILLIGFCCVRRRRVRADEGK